MPELHVRNMPADLHRRLRERSAAEGRSMSAEAIVLLRQALQPAARDQPTKQRTAMDRLREIQQRARLRAGAAPAEELVREDRDTAG